jgi:hypothetical protein
MIFASTVEEEEEEEEEKKKKKKKKKKKRKRKKNGCSDFNRRSAGARTPIKMQCYGIWFCFRCQEKDDFI